MCVPLNEIIRHVQDTVTVRIVSLIAMMYHAIYVLLFVGTGKPSTSSTSFGNTGVNAP